MESSAKVNHAQLVGAQDGSVIVPTYNWADHFDHFFNQVHSRASRLCTTCDFQKTNHGKAYVKNALNLPEKEVTFIKDPEWHPQKDKLPPIVPAPELSLERRRYLFDKIREFCLPECRDSVCPEPVEDTTPPTPKRKKRSNY